MSRRRLFLEARHCNFQRGGKRSSRKNRSEATGARFERRNVAEIKDREIKRSPRRPEEESNIESRNGGEKREGNIKGQ